MFHDISRKIGQFTDRQQRSRRDIRERETGPTVPSTPTHLKESTRPKTPLTFDVLPYGGQIVLPSTYQPLNYYADPRTIAASVAISRPTRALFPFFNRRVLVSPECHTYFTETSLSRCVYQIRRATLPLEALNRREVGLASSRVLYESRRSLINGCPKRAFFFLEDTMDRSWL